MIDLNLITAANKTLPKMNQEVLGGLSTSHLESVEQYLNDVWRCASTSFPKGLEYLGSKRCTPLEQFREITRPLNPNKKFDLLRSDVYLVKHEFRFKGVKLRPFYSFLPFVNEGGLIFLKGTQYRITTVIGGKVFNIERDNIYMPTPRIRMGFMQFTSACFMNERIIHGSVAYSHLHWGLKKTERSNLFPTLLHYILSEHGLEDTLKIYFNLDIKVGETELDDLDFEEWVVFKSRQLPITTRFNSTAEVTNIRIAIPKKQYNSLLDNVFCTLFYIIDNSVETTRNISDLNNPKLWLYLLDKFIFKVTKAEKKQFEKMVDHLESIKMIMDPITERILKTSNIKCKTTFDLFKYIILNYQDIIIHNDAGSMYHKELSTTKHLMYHVVYNIFSVMYGLQTLPENLLTNEKITSVILKLISKDKIFTVLGHGELVPASIATDCIAYSSCNVISHSKAISTGGNQRSKSNTTDPNKLLHPSQVEVCSFQWNTKREPTGRGKLSPFIKFGENNYIVPNNEIKPLIENLTDLLSHRSFKKVSY